MKTTLQQTSKRTNRKICLALFAGICLIAATSPAQVLFSENFDAMTTGVNPTGFTVNLPALPTSGTLETTVVPFGVGNGLRLLDQSGTGNAQVQQDFALSSSVHLSLSFTRNQNITPANLTSGLFVSLGFSGGNQPSLANRTMAVKVFNDGNFTFERGWQGGGGLWVSNATGSTVAYESPAGGPFGTHTLDIYAYAGTAGGSSLSYTGPDSLGYTLSPRSYSVFLDGVLVTAVPDSIASGVYGFTSSAGYTDPLDMGRFGLVTGGATARVGMDFTVDNITVSVIPEPSTFALLALGVALAGGRASRHRSGARN